MKSTTYKCYERFFNFSPNISGMSIDKLCNDVKRIFKSAYTSVQPESLCKKEISVNSNKLEIQGKVFQLSRNVHIVGFGKAVLGMAKAVQSKVGFHLVSGVISIPEGTLASLGGKKYKDMKNSCIHVYEGAHNNIPDEKSLLAAMKIKEFVSKLKETELLIVLISGGGSALLPSPKPPITLQEKQKVISALSKNGACIEELNTVRKKLSSLKGGKLALLAKPTKVISLILSDIVGDPLNLIASAPTVPDHEQPKNAISILEKYEIMDTVPESVMKVLKEASNNQEPTDADQFSHVDNFIIGNNRCALEAASQTASDLGYSPIIVTSELIGSAAAVGQNLISMVDAGINGSNEDFNKIGTEMGLPEHGMAELLDTLKSRREDSKLCLLFGGETTVKVGGSGVGGRNQELALAAAIQLDVVRPAYSLTLLSAGTDGIDGPTDAAGAIASVQIIEQAQQQNLNAAEYLNNNDSYNFYSTLSNGNWLVKTGHTGTNVMDVIIILIC